MLLRDTQPDRSAIEQYTCDGTVFHERCQQNQSARPVREFLADSSGVPRDARNRSQVAPASADSAITASAGNRCQVSKCKGSSMGQVIRITANENSNAPAPTKSPDNQPLIEAPRLTIHQSASHGSAPNNTVSQAHRRPVRAKPPSGLLVSIGWATVSTSVPANTSAPAIVASLAGSVRPGMADLNASAAEIIAAAAKKTSSITQTGWVSLAVKSFVV